MELGPIFLWKNIFSYEKIFFPMKYFFSYDFFFLRCEVWDKVVAQKGALPPSKVVLEAKNRQKTKYDFFFIFSIFSICFYVF